MSGAIVNISKKWPDGTLVAIGGTDSNDFLTNLALLVGTETADDVVKAIANSFTPVSAGSQPAQDTRNGQVGAGYQQDFRQAEQNVRQAFPDAGSSGGLVCPTHKQPVKTVEKKDGSGSFHKCQVNDSIVSNYGKPGLRDYCPKPKPRD